ncbi:MAG: hypothetical protein ACI9BD_001093, partial [Candidatus Marinamargulisbacteria bacterium]
MPVVVSYGPMTSTISLPYLVGFFREGEDKVRSVYSDSPYYYDRILDCKMKVVIAPLDVWKAPEPWVLSPDASAIKGVIGKLITEQKNFITSDRQTGPFGVLTYTMADELAMSRTGILMVKQGEGWAPEIELIDGKAFLVELKGCGSPVGKFPFTHARQAAGCYGKCHVRLTGGLLLSEAKKEFDNLFSNRKRCSEHDLAHEVRELGYLGFKFL